MVGDEDVDQVVALVWSQTMLGFHVMKASHGIRAGGGGGRGVSTTCRPGSKTATVGCCVRQ